MLETPTNSVRLVLIFISTQVGRPVTFITPDPVKLPLPSPSYLELHAACCRVANLSGASEYIHAILSDMEDNQVLSRSQMALLQTSEVFQYALSGSHSEATKFKSTDENLISIPSIYFSSSPLIRREYYGCLVQGLTC